MLGVLSRHSKITLVPTRLAVTMSDQIRHIASDCHERLQTLQRVYNDCQRFLTEIVEEGSLSHRRLEEEVIARAIAACCLPIAEAACC